MAQIFNEDARRIADLLEPESVQCVVTSPPYFGLRDYGVDGQIGLEGDIDTYIEALLEVFRGVWKVLRSDGTLWLNLGDSYAGAGAGGGGNKKGNERGQHDAFVGKGVRGKVPEGLKPKDLMGIPWRVAFALQEDGWYLRSDIIWSKPNAMPESVTDRPTKAHEYIFLLTKNPRYFYDAEAIREPARKQGTPGHLKSGSGLRHENHRSLAGATWDASGRNKRSVWTIPTQPYPEAHFATFPEKLVEPCILAGTSHMACPKCRAPWKRVTPQGRATFRRTDDPTLVTGRAGYNRPRPGKSAQMVLTRPQAELAMMLRKAAEGREAEMRQRFGSKWDHWIRTDNSGARIPTFEDAAQLEQLLGITLPLKGEPGGFRPTCTCEGNDGSGKCIVLDPFAGSGTTLAVAERLQRQAIGFELNPEYVTLIEKRLSGLQLQMTF